MVLLSSKKINLKEHGNGINITDFHKVYLKYMFGPLYVIRHKSLTTHLHTSLNKDYAS